VAVTTGAILAGASEEDIKALDTYALDVGLAFQGMQQTKKWGGKSYCTTFAFAPAFFYDPLLASTYLFIYLFSFKSHFFCLASVADDILDVTASSEDLGKTAGKDQEVGGRVHV